MNTLIGRFKRYLVFALLLLFLVFLLWIRLIIAPKTTQELASTQLSPVPPTNIPAILLTPTVTFLQNPNLSPKSKLDYQYQGEAFSNPKSLPVYTYKNMPVLNLDQAKTIASGFGFTTEPTIQNKDFLGAPIFLWAESTKKLSLGGSFPVIHYYNYSALKPAASAFPSNETLLSLAKNELQKLGVSGINDNSLQVFYYESVVVENASETSLKELTNKEGAGLCGVSLTYALSNYPIVNNLPGNNPIFLLFNSQGEIYELLVFLLPQENITSQNIALIPFNEALKNIKTKGIVLSANSIKRLNELGTPPLDLEIINLLSVKVAYFMPISFTNKVKPYYLFTGTSQDKTTGEKVKVKVLLPTE